jgi:hypothetical protein
VGAEEHRIVTDGRVNGRPARLVLDTGVSFPLAIAERAMAKFDLQRDEERPVDQATAHVLSGFSKGVRIELPPAYAVENAAFAILGDGPDSLEWDFDAIIGWPGMAGNQLLYDRRKGVLRIGQALETAAKDATTFPVLESNVLVFDAGEKGKPLPVLIDTGWSGGVQLSPALWKAWRAQNADRPHTVATLFSPSFGLVVLEQVLAPRLEIGTAVFSNVLVSEAPPSDARGSVPPAAVLGLAAFANHELLIDGISRKIHVAPAGPSAAIPAYNRLGATFRPGDMTARVAPRSPAADAGVRDGDVLVAIDSQPPEVYVAKLVTHSAWEQPAGTAITLTLNRAGERITRRVVLRKFLEF